jgi:sarcosine oxidase subunit gamma
VTDEPRARTALAPHAERLAAFGAREVRLASQASVRVDPERASALRLPTEPNTWSADDEREALWLGPDEWLVVSETGPAGQVVRDLVDRIHGGHRSVVDVSANRVAFDLAGSGRIELLRAGCGLDLDPRSWRTGLCAQTLLARVPVLLQEREDATRVFVRPSFAGWLVEWTHAVATAVPRGSGR